MSESIRSRHPDGEPTSQQPKWRQDFPVDVARDEYISRRDFAKYLVLTSGAMAVGQGYLVVQSSLRQSQKPGDPVAIARDEDVKPGQVVPFEFPESGEPCLLARLENGKLLAYGQKCTHLDCAVTPDLPNGKFICPCHNGSFDANTGQPLAGPPRLPLPRIRLEIRDGVIYATDVELRT